MIDYSGTNRVDYEDVLRAIGFFVDQNNIKEVCIIELKEGILVRGVQYTADHAGYQTISETFLFTNEDLEKVLEDAYKRRNGPAKAGIFRLKPQGDHGHGESK